MKKFIFPAALVYLGLTITGRAEAAVQPYESGALTQAQSTGANSVLHFHASWCPTCKKQKASLARVSEKTELKNVKFFEVNYDSEKMLRRDLKVTGQSTLVYLKGTKEVGRSQGKTDEGELAAEITAALKD